MQIFAERKAHFGPPKANIQDLSVCRSARFRGRKSTRAKPKYNELHGFSCPSCVRRGVEYVDSARRIEHEIVAGAEAKSEDFPGHLGRKSGVDGQGRYNPCHQELEHDAVAVSSMTTVLDGLIGMYEMEEALYQTQVETHTGFQRFPTLVTYFPSSFLYISNNAPHNLSLLPKR